MDEAVVQLLVASIAAASLGGGSVFLLRSRRADLAADTSEKISKSAGDWIDRLEERIRDLETRVEELERERDAAHHATVESERRAGKLQRYLTILQAQVIERGGVPVRLEDIPD